MSERWNKEVGSLLPYSVSFMGSGMKSGYVTQDIESLKNHPECEL